MGQYFIDNITAKKGGIYCFNKAWELLNKKELSADEKIELLTLVHASFWLWEQVPEKTKTNISIGYWQISRAYAVIQEGNLAMVYAEKCIRISNDSSVDSFYLAYGYEALSRALIILKKSDQAKEALEKAKTIYTDTKENHISGLVKDLSELENIIKQEKE